MEPGDSVPEKHNTYNKRAAFIWLFFLRESLALFFLCVVIRCFNSVFANDDPVRFATVTLPTNRRASVKC